MGTKGKLHGAAAKVSGVITLKQSRYHTAKKDRHVDDDNAEPKQVKRLIKFPTKNQTSVKAVLKELTNPIEKTQMLKTRDRLSLPNPPPKSIDPREKWQNSLAADTTPKETRGALPQLQNSL